MAKKSKTAKAKSSKTSTSGTAAKPNRNITRIDTHSTHGYQLRFQRRGNVVDKFYSDGSHGGKTKALAAARKHRDELEKKHKPYSRKEIAKIRSEKNTSGVVGVRLAEEKSVSGEWEYTYYFWVAQWSPKPGVRKTKRFSVSKYGDEEAYKMAVAARQKGVRDMAD